MNGIKAIQAALEGTQHILKWFVADFTDADLLVRPVPGANHAAWQIGNVIVGDRMILASELPGSVFPDLPPGFLEMHGKEGTKADSTEGFLTLAEYLSLFDSIRNTVISELNKLTDADLDRPVTGNLASVAPTLGHLFLLVSNHTLMHAGQFSVIRRLLGKPVLL